MFKRFIASIALCAMLLSWVRAASAAPAFELEDELVLKAALYSQCQSAEGYVLLLPTATGPRADDDPRADESGAFQDLKRRNSTTTALPANPSCPGVRLDEGGEIDRLFGHGSAMPEIVPLDARWKKFYESFPGTKGWMTLSLPGYSPDREIALVYITHYCGILCGGGAYVYLHRVGRQWKVIVTIPTWVS